MPERTTYRGRCHCGAVRFALVTEPITKGLRCNCSICIRRGAVMSDVYFPPEAFTLLEGAGALTLYHWGDHMMNHYFCATCGIHPFADPIGRPGHYRVNLGCLEDFDPLAVEIRLVDGKSF
jgi:hypothetical protein